VDMHATDLVGINGVTRVLLHVSAGCVPSRPRTAPSTPLDLSAGVSCSVLNHFLTN
jgi:hypothetical protein